MLSKVAGVNSVPHERLFITLFFECHHFMFVFIREQ